MSVDVEGAQAPPTTDARRMTLAGISLSVGEVLGKLSTLVLFSVLARHLGVADFGVFSFGIGLGLLLASFAALGLDSRLVQLAGHDPESLPDRLASLLAIRLALATVVVVVTAVVLVAVPDRPGGPTPVLLLLVAAGCADTLVEAFRAAAISRHVQTGPAVVLVLQRLAALGLVLLALLLGGGLVAMAAAYLAASVLGVLLMATTAARRAGVRPRLSGMSRPYAADFARSLSVTGVNDIVSMALFRIDVVLLAVIAGDVAVGHYTAAYRLLETVLFISWSIGRVIMPAIADRRAGAPDPSRTVSAALVLVGAIYLPYAALVLTRGEDLVRLLFGEAFVEPAVVQLLALAPLLFGLAQVGVSALLALSPDPAVLLASALALVANIGLNLVLVPRYGAAAAAAVTTVSYGVQALVLLRALGRRIPSRPVGRSLLVSTGAAVVAGAVMLAPLPALLAMALGGVAYALVWWAVTRRWDLPTYDALRGLLQGAR